MMGINCIEYFSHLFFNGKDFVKVEVNMTAIAIDFYALYVNRNDLR